MKNFSKIAPIVLSICWVPSVYAKENTASMTSLQIQSMQTKEFEAGKDVVFASVMSVLQNEGYRIQGADIQTGLITGIASADIKNSLFRRKKESPVVSAFIENFGKFTNVRLNFVITSTKTNIWTGQFDPQTEKPVLDQAVYKDAFEKIEQALFIRQNMQSNNSEK